MSWRKPTGVTTGDIQDKKCSCKVQLVSFIYKCFLIMTSIFRSKTFFEGLGHLEKTLSEINVAPWECKRDNNRIDDLKR